MTRQEANRIVSMSAGEWASYHESLVREEQDAYSRYHGVMPAHVYVAGTPQTVGHGSMVGGFVGQEKWTAAKKRRVTAERIRLGTDAAWTVSVAGSVATYSYRFTATDLGLGVCGSGWGVEIETHGIDVSGILTPTEAIEHIRAVAA